MVSFPQVLLLIAMVLVPVGCLTNWVSNIIALRNGSPMLPYQKRNCVPWGLLDLALIVIAIGGIVGVGVAIVASIYSIEDTSDLTALTPEEQSPIFIAFGSGTIIATLLSLGWIYARYQWSAGLTLARIGQDIELGVRWFMMLIVPVVLIQLVLNFWFPTHHPLIEMMRESGDISFLPVVAFAAVVAAPIFEECLFRMFLQGWFEKIQICRTRTRRGLGTEADRMSVLIGGELADDLYSTEPASKNLEADKRVDHQTDSTVPSTNPYNSPKSALATDAAFDENTATQDRPTMWLPIVVSSALFALAHLGHGPDWVPLFILALGLGYIYQRTGRILPSMVVHVLVNLLAIFQLWAAVLET